METLGIDVGLDPLSYTLIGDRVFYSNSSSCGVLDIDLQVHSWSPEHPAGQPVLTPSAASALAPGQYQVAVTFMDRLGRESGSTLAAVIDIGEGGGFELSDIPLPVAPDTASVAVYVSGPNDQVLRQYVILPAGTRSAPVLSAGEGRALTTQFLRPLPPGHIVRGAHGRQFVASGQEVLWSEALRYGMFRPSTINRFGIDKYRAQVDAYEARWRAHVAEWQGYTASVEGEGKRADLYRTLVDANAKRVDAWAASNNMQFEAERLRMAQHGVDLDVWRAGITRWDATLSGERARLAAVGQAFDAKARIYSADAGVEQAASAAADRSFELGLARERADVDVQLQQAQMRIQQMLGLLAQSAEIQRAKAQISSQLAASTMSAVNYGASVSSGRSKSNSCSQNYSFQGEIADA